MGMVCLQIRVCFNKTMDEDVSPIERWVMWIFHLVILVNSGCLLVKKNASFLDVKPADVLG